MVIYTDDLEELLSLSFPLAAALEGMNVHLYFQGPGVHVLSRRFKPKLKGWARPFSRFAASYAPALWHAPTVTTRRSRPGRNSSNSYPVFLYPIIWKDFHSEILGAATFSNDA